MKARVQQLALAHLPLPLIHWLKKRHYLRLLRKQGPDEEPDFAVIAKLVKPGDHVVDIGANYGVYMKFLADLVGDSGIVSCVEPIPSTFDIISSNATRLNLSNVRLMNYAFSDHNADALMEVPRLLTGGENYYMAKIVRGQPNLALRHVRIKTVTLDSQFAEEAIAFIKCDVEGHELPCVSGSMQTLRRCRPAWYVEVSGDPDQYDSDSWKLFEIFEAESYAPFWFDGTFLRNRERGDISVNYFFLQPSHLQNVRGLLVG